jgi:hypothetical protein
MDLYIHSSIRLHGGVLNYLSTWKTLFLPYIYLGILCPCILVHINHLDLDSSLVIYNLLGINFIFAICSSFIVCLMSVPE